MSLRDTSDMDDDDPPNFTESDVKRQLDLVSRSIHTASNPDAPSAQTRATVTLRSSLSDLQKMEGVPHFGDLFFSSSLSKQFSLLVNFPDTDISSSFLTLLTDLCDDLSHLEQVRRSNLLSESIHRCLGLDEVQIQTDAQFFYNTFNLLSTILDGLEDGKEFASQILRETDIIPLIHRQFGRDDFDENVLQATETLAILLQLHPAFISELDAGLVNLILRFCANARSPKSPSEDEAAHNAFNVISLIGMDVSGNAVLAELNGVEMLLSCWITSAPCAVLAIRSIDACLAGSRICCEQFVDGGGLKRLFGSFKLMATVKFGFPMVSMLEHLVTVLDTDSVHFKRVLRKFAENGAEKVAKFLGVCEFVAGQQSEDENEEDPAFEVLTKCCAILAVVFAFSESAVRLAVLNAIAQAETVDLETVADSAEIRVGEVGAERIGLGVSLLREVMSRSQAAQP
jgi:hypothetical protein